MMKLALRLLRQRPGTSLATLVALAGGVMILMSLAVFVESGLRYQPEPQKYAAADVVVAHRHIEISTKEFDGEVIVSQVPLPEGKVPAGLADKIRAVPGVTDVQADPQAVAVKASPEAIKQIDALAEEAGVEAYAGAERGWAEGSSSIEARSLLLEAGGAFGGYVVMLIVFVVAGTVGLSVRHRRRDLALLRAVAATPRQVRTLVVAEAAVVGLASAVIGVPAGLWATAWTHDELVTRGFLPESFPIADPALAAAVAVLTTLLIAVGAARIAARRVAKIRPAEALGEIAVEPPRGGRVRLAFGLFTLAGAGTSTFFTAGTTGTTAMAAAVGMLYLFVMAVALLAPWINAFAARLLAPVLRTVWGVSGELAAANLRANARGMAAVLSALVLSVGFGGSVWFLQDNLQRQTITQSQDGLLADRAVTAPEGLPASTADRVRRTGGVQAATGVQHTSVVARIFDGAEPVVARAVEPAQLASTMDLKVREGSLAGLTGDTIAVSALQASSSGWKVGDVAEMWLADGTPVKRTVVAIYDRGLGFGDVVMPYVSGPYDEILVRTDGHADRALASLGQVRTAGELTGQLSRDLAISAWLNKLLITVMVAYAALAAGNTMVMAALARGRELAVLRLAGVTRRQVRRMVNAEQVGLLGAALTVGVVIAGMTLVAVVRALTGTLVPYVPPLGWVVVLGGATALALVTTILPVSRLLRIPPVRAAGTKE
ncbi:ABC transporter permease [Paractinoplanes abujensis]|uniref:Putative ABC transport system permease protein n=1 Tax=Paractinoplanes abujensis TaxID=882441 RepID=A0A7W7CVK9_9ACTN|nr:ABC transporter permease [Actinoplanes abujensis]MBB4695505.1 putative ABC transport system permease protein [Actinoplanes abujensis]GID23089.1 ABC transporter permease [Actinoplanes abujensis]